MGDFHRLKGVLHGWFVPSASINIHPHVLREDLRETAISETDMIMLTDAPLLFPPGQLALAALHRSNEVHKVVDFERYLDSTISRQRSVRGALELIESIQLSVLQIPTAHDMKHIDRKLKSCFDPSSQDEKKREKRSKHKSKKASSEMQAMPSAIAHLVLGQVLARWEWSGAAQLVRHGGLDNLSNGWCASAAEPGLRTKRVRRALMVDERRGGVGCGPAVVAEWWLGLLPVVCVPGLLIERFYRSDHTTPGGNVAGSSREG
ncbi:hypothetical protein Taro_024127 [Colocasia esculenta]|uniref:Cyclin C-terminal domain-containing protein n=1 Tax=Colocasia esculenta TaxID=4460 RepID=A0A843V5L2_COLES|nr:hypothetical protein [Colocasia esculenta]